MEEEDYFRLIEDYFVQKRGRPMILSPKEWSLIREWHEAGIPEEVVLRAIDRGFEKKNLTDDNDDKTPMTLNYFRRLVKSEHKRYLKSMEGMSGDKKAASAETNVNIQQFLERLIEQLGESMKKAQDASNLPMAELLQGCREKLSAEILAPFLENPNIDLQRVEHQLTTLEKEIERLLLQTIPDSQLSQFREDAMRELKDFENKIELAVYQEMITRALIKAVRKIYNVPRLSLFYM